MTSIPFRLLAPQAFVGLMDAISYMVTAPSIVFYVLNNGGSIEMYGIILSSFSFSSFLFKPVLGYWCDKTRCYRTPYMVSLGVAALGGLVYFMASSFDSPRVAMGLILLGRLMGGVGQANNTLGFTYIAEVVEKEALTQASSVLSMVRVLGMVAAPGMNVFLKQVDTTIHLGSTEIVLTPLNSVGLFLFVGNLLAMLGIYFFLKEPERDDDLDLEKEANKIDEKDGSRTKKEDFWGAFCSIEILVPILCVFTMNFNFQLMETGLAPVANHALGWDPVKISALFGFNSILILCVVVLTFYLSSRKVSNETLLTVGLVIQCIGYTSMYFLWKSSTTVFLFALPVVLSTVCFPLLGSPNRSIYTMVIDSKPSLRHSQGTMQAIMSMVVSVAGFVAPGIISAFILREPEEVEGSKYGREFTPWALFAPVLSLLVLSGHLYVQWIKKPLEETPTESDGTTSETSSLMGHGEPRWCKKDYCVPSFDAKTEALRRESCMLMFIPQIGYEDYLEGKVHDNRRQSTGSIPSIRAMGFDPMRKSSLL